MGRFFYGTESIKMESGKINLTFLSLNVNSLNVSTLGGKVSKTFVKIEGITGKKAGILFLCDYRMGRKGTEVEKMFNLSRNGKYKIAGEWQFQ